MLVLLFAFVQSVFTCSTNFSLESKVIPKSLTVLVVGMGRLSISITYSWSSFRPKYMNWKDLQPFHYREETHFPCNRGLNILSLFNDRMWKIPWTSFIARNVNGTEVKWNLMGGNFPNRFPFHRFTVSPFSVHTVKRKSTFKHRRLGSSTPSKNRIGVYLRIFKL